MRDSMIARVRISCHARRPPYERIPAGEKPRIASPCKDMVLFIALYISLFFVVFHLLVHGTPMVCLPLFCIFFGLIFLLIDETHVTLHETFETLHETFGVFFCIVFLLFFCMVFCCVLLFFFIFLLFCFSVFLFCSFIFWCLFISLP